MDRPRISLISLAFLAVRLSLIFQKVSSSGEFQVRLLSFKNDQARDLNGDCCNGDTFSEDLRCTTPCNTYFRICLLEFRNNIPKSPLPKCTYGQNNSTFLGNNTFNISSEEHLITIPFEMTWEGDFSLIIDAWHDFHQNNSLSNPRVLTRLATQKRQGANSNWTSDSYEDDYHQLNFEYRIVCGENYYGRTCGKVCVPIDNFVGHYRCDQNGDRVCLPGWTGQWCTTAVCESCVHGTCKADEPGVCECQSGYTGEKCDQCIPFPGCVHGTCSTPGQCLCEEGWRGTLCDIDRYYCSHNTPCRNGARCYNEGPNGYRCYCQPGFTGADCSIKVTIPECPCENGGTCLHNADGTQICSCPPGTTGPHCESLVTSCDATRCLHGGTCINIPSGYQCQCRPGYNGNNCEQVDICDTTNNPCIHGGTCLNQLNGYECICRTGFSGRHCEVNICESHSCDNGGTCVATADNARCECAPGFSGERCEIHPNYCDSSPCENGGSCNELDNNGYFCDCALGFRGKNCEIPQCERNVCENGGTCSVDREGGILCTCAPGFGGVLCSDKLIHSPKDEISTVPVKEEPSPLLPSSVPKIQDKSSDLMIMLLFVIFGVIIVLIVLLMVVIIYRKHKSDTRQRNIEEGGAPPNNRAVLTYTDNFSHEEKVLPLLSISEKICNKEIDNYKSKTTFITKDYSISNSHSQSNSINKELTDFSSKDLKSLRCPPSERQCNSSYECNSSNVVRYVPQSRHSFSRNCDADEFYYYDDKNSQLKRTDSLQTNSQSSSLESTPKHTAKCPVLQISAVVEDSYPSAVRLHGSEV